MSILFYGRPDYLSMPSGPINQEECQRYVERARKSERTIPDGLSFDEILNKATLPPCSLNDFMDYLVYVEHNAENLQFFLWYKDYCQRFDALSEAQKSLSPHFVPNPTETPDLSKDVEKDAKIRKVHKEASIAMMKTAGYDSKGAALFDDEQRNATEWFEDCLKSPSVSVVTSVPSDAEVTAQAGLKWQPYTIQPMREEINRIARHYLAFTAPRELNLSHKDRALCLHALQHTTNPSALLPAVKICEAALRGQSHPNFIRWSICNGNKPRVFFVRIMGVQGIVLGFALAIFFTLSSWSRWYRIFAAILWYIGFSTIVAAYKGLCILMHFSHSRSLRPWEQPLGDDLCDSEAGRKSSASNHNHNVPLTPRTPTSPGFQDSNSSINKENDVEASGYRPSSTDYFGPKNSFDSSSWVMKYEKKPLLRKIFEKSVWTENATLRLLQDKIVIGANIWAFIITVPLTTAFVALPKGNFFG